MYYYNNDNWLNGPYPVQPDEQALPSVNVESWIHLFLLQKCVIVYIYFTVSIACLTSTFTSY